MPGEEYKVSLEVFEGPLDLLLYLIKKDELDIFNIPIEHVTKQYLGYVDMMKMLDLNIAGEFLVMAATLMMIKSRMLLPVEDRPELEDEEDDPRWELVRQLVEYKKFKDAAEHLDLLIYLDANEADLERWFLDRFMVFWEAGKTDAGSFYHRFREMSPEQARGFGLSVWQGINLPNLREHIVRARQTARLVVKKGPDHALSLVREI